MKYAKWKAAYIHRCLKNGETPIAGPLPEEGEEEEGAVGGEGGGESSLAPWLKTRKDSLDFYEIVIHPP